MPTELELAAFHEAGHVVARAYRCLPMSPLVEISDSGNGETHGTGQVVQFDPFAQAVVILAGPAAEWRYGGRTLTVEHVEARMVDLNDGSDSSGLAQLVREHGVHLGYALTQVHGLIFAEHWQQVETVARALLAAEGNRLTADQLAPLVEGI